MKDFVHFSRRFLCPAIEPPSQQRQQTTGEGHSVNCQFPFSQLQRGIGFREALRDSARKVALREIEEILETAAVGQRTVHLVVRSADVLEHLPHRDNSMRVFFLLRKQRAHRFQEHFQLAKKEVVFVAEVKVESGTTYRCPVQYLLDRNVIDSGLSATNWTRALPSRWCVRRMRSSGF